MKGLLLMLAFCLLMVDGAIAKKIRFMDTGNVWRVYNTYGTIGEDILQTITYKMGRDTAAFGKIYKIPTGSSYQLEGFNGVYRRSAGLAGPRELGLYREDTILNKVWCVIFRTGVVDTTEHLIYDHNWKVGDTLFWPSVANGNRGWIGSIDSTYFLNEWYRVFKIQLPHGSSFLIIEGIGSTGGTKFPAYPETFEESHRLSCFKHNGVQPLISPQLLHFNNTTSCALDVDVTLIQIEKPSVYPNPGGKGMLLQIPETFTRVI